MTEPPACNHLAYLAFGSNLGDRREHLRQGRALLAALFGVQLEASSALYASTPCGGPPGQGEYLNAVVRVATLLTPHALLHGCQQIETACGRVRTTHWGARTLDIDLLLYDVICLEDGELILPHPRMHERGFVLQPLCELAPDLVHPRLRATIRQLARQPGLAPVQRQAGPW